MVKSKKREFGDAGEKIATELLLQNGYRIVETNFRVKNLGEIDIVSIQEKQIVFVEVKTRNVSYETSFPIGFAIGPKKKRNLKRICQIYLLNNEYPQNQDWRVDAIFVSVNRETGSYETQHIENILWDEYY
ncbi:MAG: hypothetical protein A2934_05465 [Candidatus Sungbacteria bacterium RIFCSPLOWO2_01_FULL_47_10]|uniref:UPF0102 protein A2934_05465 n=1 Tax=Candidatus Sungbacteria bacterium RIFCSPLOWO2_01_FULL_47_10 TaxID=1802276 RepID=A0A1G2L1K5_9BACT|nr:MAG: hypothetical protein A2934_05465 [Candidatus Sungbacteria bacterium RIFCSPLOWO2_01_FULL_47_10]